MQTKEYPLFVLQLFAPGLSAVLSVFCSPVHENVLRWKLCFPCLFPAIWIRRCYNNTDEDYSSILLVFSLLFCSVLLLDSDGKWMVFVVTVSEVIVFSVSGYWLVVFSYLDAAVFSIYIAICPHWHLALFLPIFLMKVCLVYTLWQVLWS